jgi:hypothetical protein
VLDFDVFDAFDECFAVVGDVDWLDVERWCALCFEADEWWDVFVPPEGAAVELVEPVASLWVAALPQPASTALNSTAATAARRRTRDRTPDSVAHCGGHVTSLRPFTVSLPTLCVVHLPFGATSRRFSP